MAGIEFDGVNNKIELNTGAAAADQHILFNGNAQDFYIGLDDSADDLLIGLGSAVGTTPIIAIDENKLSTFSGAITVGVDDTGHDVKLFGATSGKYWLWDESADGVVAVSNLQQTGTITVGVDDTGHDVKLFGATSGSYALWDESADDLNLIASGLGVGTAKDLGTGIHVRTSDSGASVPANYDELVLENANHCGMTILSGTSSAGAVRWGDSGDNDVAGVIYDHNINEMTFKSNTAEVLRLGNSMDISTGGEDAPDVTDGGICLDQGADDAKILTFKSSDVDHEITNEAETDTFFNMKKGNAAVGGVRADALCEQGNETYLHIALYNNKGGEIDTTTSTSGNGCMKFGVNKLNDADADGAANQASPDDANCFVFNNYTANAFIIKGDGDIYYNGADQGAFDDFDDAQLVRSLDLSRDKNLAGVINSKFDEYINYNHETLADAKLVGREEDGTPNHMINITGMQRLHNGAIWQQYEKHQKLANAMYELAKVAVGEEKANEILKENDIKLLN